MAENIVDIAPVFQRWSDLYTLAPGQGGGRVPSAWQGILSRDPMMRNVVMVLELVFGGVSAVKTLRVSTAPVSSTSHKTGARFDAIPILGQEPEVGQDYTLGVGTSSARSFPISVSAKYVDAVSIIRKGGTLAGFVEVYLQTTEENADHDRRYVLIRGDLTSGSFAEQGETTTIEVVDPKETLGSRLPPWVLDSDRFANIHKTAVGERLPLVFNSFTNIPALRVTDGATGAQTFVFGYGSGYTVNASTGVLVNGVVKASGDATYGWSLVGGADDKGTPYVAINFTNGATAWEDSDAVHVTVSSRPTQHNVIQMIRNLMRTFSPMGALGINEELFATAEARMQVKSGISVLINASGGGAEASATKWVEEGFLESFPMLSMVWENGGYGPVLTDRRLSPIAHWVVGQGPLLDRDTPVRESSKAKIFNSFVVRYGYDPLLDTYAGVVVRNFENSAVCAYSRDTFGERHAKVLESPYITTAAMAAYVADWMVDHTALPSFLVDYVATPDVIIRYRRGDRIDLTEEGLTWSRERAIIQQIRYSRSRAVVALRVWFGPLSVTGPAAFSAAP